MQTANAIWGFVALGGVVVAGICFPGAAKAVGRFIVRAAVLSAVAFALNFALRPLGLDVGINPATAIVAGFLGVPGVVAMYVARAVFV